MWIRTLVRRKNWESCFKSLLLIENEICCKPFRVMESYKIIVKTNLLNERKMCGQVLLLFLWQTKPNIEFENAIERRRSKWSKISRHACWKHSPLNHINLSKCLLQQAFIFCINYSWKQKRKTVIHQPDVDLQQIFSVSSSLQNSENCEKQWELGSWSNLVIPTYVLASLSY